MIYLEQTEDTNMTRGLSANRRHKYDKMNGRVVACRACMVVTDENNYLPSY